MRHLERFTHQKFAAYCMPERVGAALRDDDEDAVERRLAEPAERRDSPDTPARLRNVAGLLFWKHW
jgi:hypothetical protein